MIKESIKKRHIVKYLLFSIVCLCLQGCLYYNYGVKMTNPSLKYKKAYYGGYEKKKYQFQSFIYALENKPEDKDNPNYLSFNIAVEHLNKETYPGAEYRGDYISEKKGTEKKGTATFLLT